MYDVLISYFVDHDLSVRGAIYFDTKSVSWRSWPANYLRGAIVMRTHQGPLKPYIPLFLRTILGPDYFIAPW